MSGELTDGSVTVALAALAEPAVAFVWSNNASLEARRTIHGIWLTIVDYTVGQS